MRLYGARKILLTVRRAFAIFRGSRYPPDMLWGLIFCSAYAIGISTMASCLNQQTGHDCMASLFKVVLLVMSISTNLCAWWNPCTLENVNSAAGHCLEDDGFLCLKGRVAEALANSWCSPEKANMLMDLTLLTQPEICVEVGAFTGSSSLPIAATLRHMGAGQLFAIDAWSNSIAVQNMGDDDINKEWWAGVDMAAVYNCFVRMLETWGLGGYCTIIKKPSGEAVREIPDSIDLLHLDGDYSEIGSLSDVELYLPKVKSGGYVILSNLFLMVNREQPKIKAFCVLCEACEIVATIENDNTVLFRKN